jgi:ribonuclease G
MPKEILVNARPYETRIAVLENGKLAELYIERDKRSIVGNIYKGKVKRVLPGMQSAFVDIGLEKDAFLYVEDVIANLEKMLEIWSDPDSADSGGKKKVGKGRGRKKAEIGKLLKKGENILVQVAKERIGTKGARITSHISLPGKYVVLMPTVDRIGISKKITSQDERKRLRDLLLKFREPQFGYIVRTAAEGCGIRALRQDLNYLHGLWSGIAREADSKAKVGLIHAELDLLHRVLRDVFSNKFARIVIDVEEPYMAAVDFLHLHQKSLANRVRLYTGRRPVFEEYGVEDALKEAVSRRVRLKSGGSIVIHHTEALVAIDVNTGRFVGSKSLEDTALKTNLEAARAIVQQMRLRELGGIIVIDFIDMEKRQNRKALIDFFNKELKKDKAERTVLNINEFGMVLLTRKRVRGSLERLTTSSCPYCDGHGAVKTPETIACEILRELERIGEEGVKGELRVALHPDVFEFLAEGMETHLRWVKSSYGMEVSFRANKKFHHEQFDILEL